MNNSENNIGIGLPKCSDKVILIDCMDTVFYRNLSLESILKIWSSKMNKIYGINRHFLSNYRFEVVSSAMHNTVPIETIYCEIYDHCKHFGLINSVQKNEFVEVSHKIELETELKYLHVIPETVEFLRDTKSCGAQIYCVSDFRLSRSDIKEFFSKHNIGHYFDDVFSSCEVGKTKKDGSLYKYVLECIQKDSSECLMIGDNYKSDCVNACKNGIESYQVQKKKLSLGSSIRDLWLRFS